MQYPKIFNDNKIWQVSEVQSGKKVDENCVSVSDAGQTNLIINYLPADMTEIELFEIFNKIGEVAKYKIVRNRRTGQSLGYGFVEFKNASAARNAQLTCNRHVIRGKSLKVAFARPQSEDIINANLYISYLPRDIDENKLATLFGCYGTIIEVKVLRCKVTGKPRGAGFVRFDQRLAAEVAMKALNNYVLKDATQPLSIQFARGNMLSNMHERFSFSPKRQVDSEAHLPPKRVQESFPFSRPIKHEMEPEIVQTAKRQMVPQIAQTAKRNKGPYPFSPLVKRYMESNIQQRPRGPEF